MQRQVNASKKLATEELQIGVFALHNTKDKEDEVLFACDGAELTRKEMMILCVGIPVGTQIVDAWAIIQNKKEIFRAIGSDVCFNATTNVCANLLGQTKQSCKYEEKRSFFYDDMSSKLLLYNHTAFTRIDLFIFPIYDGVKFYGVIVDTKRCKILIVDSTNNVPQACRVSKYGTTINELQRMLSEFLTYKGENYKSQNVRKSKPTAIVVKWGDNNNITDTGVYLMRHMETYKGQTPTSWISGLLVMPTKQLKLLRGRYCAEMIGCASNYVRDDVKRRAKDYYNDVIKKTDINVEGLFV